MIKTEKSITGGKLASRRDKASVMADHRVRAENFLASVDATAAWVSSAVISMLNDSDDDVDTSDSRFRSGVQNCFRKVLVSISSKKEKVVFLNEAVPGFTVLSIKKDGWGEVKKPNSKKPEYEAERSDAVNKIISAYVKRTGKRVLMVEGDDIVLIMFPVADLKKNLEDMGFVWVD